MSQFVTVIRKDELPPDRCRKVEIGPYRLAVFHVEGEFYVIDDRCSHAEASLSEGKLSDKIVLCPRHGAKFDITTGKALSLPAFKPVRSYEVRVEGDDVQVKLDLADH